MQDQISYPGMLFLAALPYLLLLATAIIAETIRVFATRAYSLAIKAFGLVTKE